MQKANRILQALRKLGEKGLPLTRAYRNLYCEELFLVAYNKIGRKQGSLTPGVDNDIADGMSLERIASLIELLRYERFNFRPARRIHIPKKSKAGRHARGGKRALGLPNFSDKLVQEVLRMMLEAYYEPQFKDSSHGYRPNRGCHTALRRLKESFQGSAWLIEGDIKGCFNSIDHEILMAILAQKIKDGRLLDLIRRSLKAGVMDGWQYHKTYSGTPQGSVLSPLLANIYLHELDTFIEETLIPQYTRGKERVINLVYKRYEHRIKRARERGDHEMAQKLRQERRQHPSRDMYDPNFRRLRYLRYADDFILGFSGPKSEAEQIKDAIRVFSQNRLKLEMSASKTLITHALTEKACFLGYSISIYKNNDVLKRTNGTNKIKVRSINGHVRLGIPHGLTTELAKRYQRNGKAIHEASLLAFSDAHIINVYQQRFRGLAEYYKYAVDRCHLGKLKYVMEIALVKTLANKYRISVSQVYRKYAGRQIVDGYIVFDELPNGADFMFPAGSAKSEFAQEGRIFVGLATARHPKDGMRFDPQSLINLHPFPMRRRRAKLDRACITPEKLLEWAEWESGLFLEALGEGKVGQIYSRLAADEESLERLSNWHVAEYIASPPRGGEALWWRSALVCGHYS